MSQKWDWPVLPAQTPAVLPCLLGQEPLNPYPPPHQNKDRSFLVTVGCYLIPSEAALSSSPDYGSKERARRPWDCRLQELPATKPRVSSTTGLGGGRKEQARCTQDPLLSGGYTNSAQTCEALVYATQGTAQLESSLIHCPLPLFPLSVSQMFSLLISSLYHCVSPEHIVREL